MTNKLFDFMKMLFSYSYIASLCAILSACGFQLKGTTQAPAELQEICTSGTGKFSELALELRTELPRSGFQVLSDCELASARINITESRYVSRVIAVDEEGKAQEYELKYVLGFYVTDKNGKTVIPSRTITQRRSYKYDPDNALASGEEARLIRLNMMESAVRQIVTIIKQGGQSLVG